MFKVICDVKLIELSVVTKALTRADSFSKGSLSPAAVKHDKAIAYDNCKACDVGDFMLTSTSERALNSEINNILEMWNRNILNPANKGHHAAYRKILNGYFTDNFDIKNFKHVSIFEKDRGLHQEMFARFQLVHVFEVIVDITQNQHLRSIISNKDYYQTGYEAYYDKYSFFEVTNRTQDTFIAWGALRAIDDTSWCITSYLAPYLLRHRDTLDCPEVKYDVKTNKAYGRHIDEYIKFLKEEFVTQLSGELFFLRNCYTEDGLVALIDASTAQESSQIDVIKSLCINMGGRLESMQETMERVCQKIGAQYKLYGNDLFTVTCDNYESLITFDTDGEILSGELMTTFVQQHQAHNEL